MEFSASSPESSSGSDSRPSHSPHFMSADLGLDPSDPLNLLLHNSSQSSSGDSSMEDSSQEGGSPPDWSQLSALWPENDAGQIKPYTDPMDFGDLTSLPMDMDFNPSMSIEPSALHFDPMKFANYAYGEHLVYSNNLLTPPFPFSFQPVYNNSELSSSTTSPQLSTDGHRRLSITSSSSSSGASFSPAPEFISSPAPISALPTATSQPSTQASSAYASDPAAELAERVRQAAGIMLALPMNAQLQALEMKAQASASVSNNMTAAPKLPIPRLPQHMAPSTKSTLSISSAASTPPPSTPSPPPSVLAPGASASLPRPKTSHTTIERRYRTNLNARIQSLRMAVPALRVVEDREGGKKKAPNKVLSDGIKLEGGQDVISPGGVIDVIDERGFVDGVKVARKCSKANVLGKAVEYIRVLKKRENRLKAEQSGLKALISGLVGGPALLREWEREWREKFGGEEKDEVEGEVDQEGDDEDSEDEQDDAEEEGRKRKRGKIATAPAPKKAEKKPVDPNAAVPEKRKRGRPRKIVPPVTPADQSPVIAQHEPSMTSEQSAPQYLLATFALFSFYNSPLTTSSSQSSSHTHTGTVLNNPTALVSRTWGMTEYIQMFHLLVSVIVLLSFISSWIGFGFGPKALSSISWRHRFRKQKKTRSDWVKMGEECVLAEPTKDVSVYTRVQIYKHITSWDGASAQDLTTAALVMYGASNTLKGLAKFKARSIWSAATAKAQTTNGTASHEKMVLEGMTVDEAFERLNKDATKRDRQPPIQILASALVKERVRKHLGLLFIGSVRTNTEGERDVDDKDQMEQDILERQKAVEAAKEIGGSVGELGRTLERVWKLGADCQVGVEDVKEDESGINEEIKALLAALVLYRRLFPSVGNGASALLSPPPSPGREETNEVGILRRALGSRAFEESNALEDARDRAVDVVVELERRSVGLE